MPEPTNDKWVYSQRTKIATLLKQPNLSKCEHAGLWFDACINRQQKKGTSLSKEEISPYKALVDIVAAIPEPQIYAQFFERWKEQIETMQLAVDGCEYRVQCRYAAAQGRIALGLGDESVIETSVTLHHTYGVPFIPGSALKGLASAYAHRVLEGENWRKGGEYHKAMFGTTDSAGYVVFLDAMYCPGTGHPNPKSEGKAQALWPDVITVHHPEYYTGGDPKPPADWDSPTPVPFLTATGTYLIALGGPLAWVELGFKILEKALAEMGIGAKTSSGYGRMKLTKQMSVQETSGSAPAGTILEETSDTPNNTVSGQRSTPPAPPSREPKRGQDLWGKVIDRRERKWIVLLEESGLELRATDQNVRGKVDFGTRVRVRVENTQPLEGSIKDVRRQ